jgi:DNA-binding CsgD family transcriptional regulator
VACLDESMAGSLGGEGVNRGTVVMASCNMIISCSECAEFERAVQWVRAADRFTRRYGCPFLYVECRVFYGGVLVATGDWRQAEEELRLALSASRSSMPALHRKALATLAELRFVQGRLEEAERLVAGLENHHEAAPVQAAIHLARGKPTLATAVIRRRLDVIGEGQLESAQLVELLGEADIVEGRHERAEVRGRELAAAAAAVGCAVAAARGERLWGHALAVGSDGAGAPQHLEAALSAFIRLEMPFEAARTRLLLAETLREVEPDVAAAEASGALAAFEDLGAGADADIAAALLRQLGVKAARSGPKRIGTLTKREREVLGLLGEGLSNPEIAGRLHLSRKTVEHHVASVLAKLGARSRAEAAAAAVRQDWVESAAR